MQLELQTLPSAMSAQVPWDPARQPGHSRSTFGFAQEELQSSRSSIVTSLQAVSIAQASLQTSAGVFSLHAAAVTRMNSSGSQRMGRQHTRHPSCY